MVSIKQVEHVAKLARLELSDKEKELFSAQLTGIIGYFKELAELDTEGVEPMSHCLSLTNVMRADEVELPPGRDAFLTAAPGQEAGYFKVPRIID